MSLVLLIDTIQPQYHLAIYNDKTEISSITGEQNSKTSLEIAQQISFLLNNSKISKSEIDKVAIYTCSVSVTGAQIGQATAEALSLGLNIPLIKLDLYETIKSTISPTKYSNSVALIKISDKYFAWADLSEQLQRNGKIWRQGSFKNFESELQLNPLRKNIYVYVSDQAYKYIDEPGITISKDIKFSRLIMNIALYSHFPDQKPK